MSFQAQNFLEILKATILETNRNSSRTMTENERERERERESYRSGVAEIHGRPCAPAEVADGQDR